MTSHSLIVGDIEMIDKVAKALLTVLHIDDEFNQCVVARILQKAGFAIVTAKTGEEGLHILNTYPPDLIILNVQLPGMSGLDVCKKIRANPKTAAIPILYLSAHSTQGLDKAQGLDSGADAYLVQPIEPIELIATVKALLRIRKAEESLRFLVKASTMLVHSLNCETILNTLAELAVPYLADWCVIYRLHHDGSIHPLVILHADSAKVELAWNLARQYPITATNTCGIGRAMQTKQAVLMADLSNSFLPVCTSNGEHFQHLQKLALQSCMVVPLIVHHQLFGMVRFVTAESGRCYSQLDLTLAQDLTRQTALAIENAQLYRKAQEANQLKDEFLSTLSHELRSPLNAILGWTRLLNTRKFSEATTARAMETIERSATTQAQLVEDLLDVSQLIRGKLRLNIQSMDLIATVQEAIATVYASAKAKNIQIQFFEPKIGLMLGDSERLQQVVWNILSNAVKFTPEKGQIRILLERSQTHIQLAVIDTGKGIDPEFAPFVFDRFRQADSSTTRTYNGLGLGLAIVRHLVELHGGTVTMSSEGEGQGSTFIVKLPLMQQPAHYQPIQTTQLEESMDRCL